MNVATVTLVMPRLDDPARLCDDLGDAQAFEVLQEFYRIAQDLRKSHKGAVVETGRRSAPGRIRRLRRGRACRRCVGRNKRYCGDGPALVPRIGVHRGAALATTLNDHLDYFGNSVNRTFRLLKSAGPGDVVLSQEVSADLPVHELLQSLGRPTETICAAHPKSGDEIVQRVRSQTTPAAGF